MSDVLVEAPFIFRSAAMRAVLAAAREASSSSEPVLITGEPGVGKMKLTRFIHRSSMRREGPCVYLGGWGSRSRTLPTSNIFGFAGDWGRRGRLEGASGGTAIVTEAEEMDPTVQDAFLEYLSKGPGSTWSGLRFDFDVRLIFTTSADLEAKCAEGTFSRELLGRLRKRAIHIPPLRERREDVAALVEYILEWTAKSAMSFPGKRFSDDAMKALEAHAWELNVRAVEAFVLQAAFDAAGEVMDAEYVKAVLAKQ